VKVTRIAKVLLAIASSMAVSALCWWYAAAAADPIDAAHLLGVNQPGTETINDSALPSFVDGVNNSGARWTMMTVQWFQIERPETPPTPGNCPHPDFYDDGTYTYYRGPSGHWCHTYLSDRVLRLDRLINSPSGLKAAGHFIAMGIMAPPNWAGGGTADGGGGLGCGNCAIVYRDHLSIFSDGARDLSSFLVSRYTPGAFSVWNEPNGYAYLSIEPDPHRVFLGPKGPAWPAWEDYVTYLLQPIANDLHALQQSPLVLGPELSIRENGDSNASDPNWPGTWGNSINVGFWLSDWSDYILRNYSSLVDRWTIHTYSDTPHDLKLNVDLTYDLMISMNHLNFIWITEANMATGGCNKTQRQRAEWFCQVSKDQTWNLTFVFPAVDGDGCTAYSDPDSPTGSGLMNTSGQFHSQKWLLDAFRQILAGTFGGPAVNSCNFSTTLSTGIQSFVTETNANASRPIVTVDGQTYATPHTFAWPPGSAHTIVASTQLVGPTQYNFVSWSDGGAISHVVSPTANTTYTMNFTTPKKRRAQLTSQ
jgi:hypothetical protein